MLAVAEKQKDPKVLEHYVRQRLKTEIEAHERGYRMRVAEATGIADAQLTEWVKERGLPGMTSIRRLADRWWHTTIGRLAQEAERWHGEQMKRATGWTHPELAEALSVVAHLPATEGAIRTLDASLPASVHLTPDQARELVLNVERTERANSEGSGVQETLPQRLTRRRKAR